VLSETTMVLNAAPCLVQLSPDPSDSLSENPFNRAGCTTKQLKADLLDIPEFTISIGLCCNRARTSNSLPQRDSGAYTISQIASILVHVPSWIQLNLIVRIYLSEFEMTQPLSEADILFPHLSNNPSFSSTLSSLKRSALSIHNRLASIVSDSEFVDSVAEAYQLPLVANERCGSWYIPAEKKAEGVYFKSTDGHMGEWGFSLRRLNFQLLDVVHKHGGAVVVDSTRRGKSMPDALSKTIPIWCCVINRAVFAMEGDHAMYTPPHAVSSSEHAQISNRIDGFMQQFLVGLYWTNLVQQRGLIMIGHLQAKDSRASCKTTKATSSLMGHATVFTARAIPYIH
jgi:hypothetical protein